MEKADAGPLPLFRSAAQAQLLARLFLGDGPLSLSDLSRETAIPVTSVHREVERLEGAGLVESLREGNLRKVTPNRGSPYYPELRSLLTKAMGPVTVLRKSIEPLQGIEAAYVFGSWARRHNGEPGPLPRDIDLLVVGEPTPGDVHRAVRRAEAELGMTVNATVLSKPEWLESESGFLRSVREGPLVSVAGFD